MNNEELIKNLSGALKSVDEAEFKAYLVSDESFDLDSDREDNNNMPKVVVWPKGIQIEGDQEAKFEEITAKVINFTQGVGQQINPKLYVVGDDLPAYAEWLMKNPKYSNFIISISTGDLVSKMKPAIVNSEPVPAPVSEQTQPSDNSQPPVAGETEVKTEAEPAVAPLVNNPETAVATPEVPKQPTESIPEQPQPVQGIAPMVQPEAPVMDKQGPVLVKTPATTRRAGFVKFPIFVLTLMAIGAFGIFIGKLLFTFFNK